MKLKSETRDVKNLKILVKSIRVEANCHGVCGGRAENGQRVRGKYGSTMGIPLTHMLFVPNGERALRDLFGDHRESGELVESSGY